ncbi:MAG: polyprenyl synthetase family protein, partial [Flavobacteriales bacterium]
MESQPQQSLYQPVSYIMQLGGKRLRPLMVLAATEAFGGDPKLALNACMSIEVFHNFTLMHDDIMDDAPLRRGNQTVHEKWGVNAGILSGDAMIIQAYQLLNCYNAPLSNQLLTLFNTTALEVCEGQQMDMEFEDRNDVGIEEYLEMIRLKTSVLLAAALKMGAQIAGASDEVQKNIYNFGQEIGLAFQLRDDYLDAFGDPETFGKQVGGDIIQNKKTYLLLE